MAFKLTKAEARLKSQLAEHLEKTIDVFEDVQGKAVTGTIPPEELNPPLAAIIVAVTAIEDFRSTIAERFRGEFEEKSEKWQESDKAGEVDAFIEEWESASFEPPDTSEPLELELDDYIGDLENLPDEAS